MDHINAAQNEAAGDIVELVAARVGSGRAVHPETAIASAARLSGCLLLHSFDVPIDGLEPGTVVLSKEANEKGPQLIEILSAFLAAEGVTLDRERLGADASLRGETPDLDCVQSLSALLGDALHIAERLGLDYVQIAQSAALATAFLVKECAADIGSEVGFNVATYSFIEGSKTVPPTAQSAARTATPKKPWYQFW